MGKVELRQYLAASVVGDPVEQIKPADLKVLSVVDPIQAGPMDIQVTTGLKPFSERHLRLVVQGPLRGDIVPFPQIVKENPLSDKEDIINPVAGNKEQSIPDTGITQSERTRRQRISDAMRGQKKSEEARRNESIAKGGVMVTVTPLFLRGALNEEAAQVTRFSYSQVESLRVNLRQQGRFIPTDEERHSIRSKANRISRMKRRQGGEYTQEQENRFNFAKHFVEQGFFTEDTTMRDELVRLYAESSRELPEIFADQLLLEVFLTAQKHVSEGSHELLQSYKTVGEEINPELFEMSLAEEERFIREKIGSSERTHQESVQVFVRPSIPQKRLTLRERLAERNGKRQETETGVNTHFVELLEAQRSLAFGMLKNLGVNPSSIEDVLQTVAEKVLTKGHTYTPTLGQEIPWLMRVIKNAGYDELRRQAKEYRRSWNTRDDGEDTRDVVEKLIDPSELVRPEDSIIAAERSEIVHNQLVEINTLQQDVLIWSYFDGKTQAEIAEDSRRPLGTVKSQTRLGLKKLKENTALQEYYSAN